MKQNMNESLTFLLLKFTIQNCYLLQWIHHFKMKIDFVKTCLNIRKRFYMIKNCDDAFTPTIDAFMNSHRNKWAEISALPPNFRAFYARVGARADLLCFATCVTFALQIYLFSLYM